MTLRLGRHSFADDRRLMMAIVNRTPGLLLRQGRDLGRGQGHSTASPRWSTRVPRSSTSAASRPRPASRSTPRRRCGARSASSNGCARTSRRGDQRRHLARARWPGRLRGRRRRAQRRVGGADPALVDAAAEHDAGIVCTHTGGVLPADPPAPDRVRRRGGQRAADTTAYAERALAAGVPRESILIDPPTTSARRPSTRST